MRKLVAAASQQGSSAARLLGPGAARLKGSTAMLLQFPAAMPLLLLAPVVAVLSLLPLPLQPLLLSPQLKMLQSQLRELSRLLRRHAWHERCGVVLEKRACRTRCDESSFFLCSVFKTRGAPDAHPERSKVRVWGSSGVLGGLSIQVKRKTPFVLIPKGCQRLAGG